MARVLITGSADGLGQLAAKELVRLGHQVVLHARNAARSKEAIAKVPGAETVLTADLSSIDETKALAASANASGKFDAVIHNAGLYQISKNALGADGLPLLFTVNTLAPYILTSLITRPKRLIYLSSGMHLSADPQLTNLPSGTGSRKFEVSYSDTKLHDLIFALALARRWPDVYANAVNPGWVPTKMGGAGAPDSLEKGYQTQVWLAVSDDAEVKVSGKYFHHKKQRNFLPVDIKAQEKLISFCEELTGVRLPA